MQQLRRGNRPQTATLSDGKSVEIDYCIKGRAPLDYVYFVQLGSGWKQIDLRDLTKPVDGNRLGYPNALPYLAELLAGYDLATITGKAV